MPVMNLDDGSAISQTNPMPTTNGTALSAIDVVPHDVNEIPRTKRIYVGVAGDVKALLSENTIPVVFKALPVGFHDISAKVIWATGTTATDILAIY
jgi:hypothetical protein